MSLMLTVFTGRMGERKLTHFSIPPFMSHISVNQMPVDLPSPSSLSLNSSLILSLLIASFSAPYKLDSNEQKTAMRAENRTPTR